MAVKLRLQRQGRKKYAFYHVVATDERAPRDGRYIERVGSYNPNTDPATIDLDFDKCLSWVQKGAVPTDTVRAMLSYTCVLHKNHLLKGAAKGAFTEEEAEAKFQEWLSKKEGAITSKREKLAAEKQAKEKEDFEREAEVRAKREAEIAAKNAPEVEETEEVEATAEGDAPAEEGAEAPAEATSEEAAETSEEETKE